MAQSEDLYAQLGLEPSAAAADVARAYAGLVAANATDPDKLLRLSNAFQILANPLSRAEYDRTRGAQNPANPGEILASPGLSPDDSDLHAPLPGTPVPDPAAPVFTAGSPGPIGDATARVDIPDVPPQPVPIFGATTLPGGPPAPMGEVTQRPTTIACPVCGTSNMSGLTPAADFCQDCGFLLSQTPGEGPEVPPSSAPRLVSADGAREFLLRQGPNTVGRQDADVLLSDTTVSRLHARLYLEGEKLEVEDAGSTNGTKVNGVRLESGTRTAAGENDELQFGHVALRVRGTAPGAAGPTGTIVEPGPRPPAPAAPAGPALSRLVALAGGQEYMIYGYPARVGRRADVAVPIQDPYVSGLHAEMVQEDGQLMVRDLGSTNGTIVGSEPLTSGTSALLGPGSIITFGKQRFRFETAVTGPDGETAWIAAAPESSETAQPAGLSAEAEETTPEEPAAQEPAAAALRTGEEGAASPITDETVGREQSG